VEQLGVDEPAALVVNNISMHECRDIDLVTENVLAALEPGGWFVISDSPFPDTEEGLRSVPGRVMGAIQFFEAQIDDQLLPRAYYDDLLARHGFTDPGSASITPMHASPGPAASSPRSGEAGAGVWTGAGTSPSGPLRSPFGGPNRASGR
jgi:hypothetical protein